MSNEMNLPLDASRTGMLRDSRGVVIGDIFFPDKAAHIVKCVNAHDGLVEALQKLACLGNGDQYGNSDGNCIAQAALAAAAGEQK